MRHSNKVRTYAKYNHDHDVPMYKCPCETWFVCTRLADVYDPYCLHCKEELGDRHVLKESRDQAEAFSNFVKRIKNNGPFEDV